MLVLTGLFGLFPFLSKLFADGGYQRPQFRKELAKLLPRLSVEIVKRSDQARGFAVLPKRGLWNGLSPGSIAAADWLRIGKT